MGPPPPQTAPPGRSFQDRIENADPNCICTASHGVGIVPFSSVLTRKLRIPLFQRRYAWNVGNWCNFLNDVLACAMGLKPSHSLGRLTCVEKREGLIVIDGQQRCTTAVLLLAALRDVAEGEESAQFRASIDELLFSSPIVNVAAEFVIDGFLREGANIENCVLIPTYCDRSSFFAALLNKNSSGDWRRPIEAKNFMIEQLRKKNYHLNLKKLQSVRGAILNKLKFLKFPITLQNKKKNDGTDDLLVIFERLALREAMWARPPKRSEYAEMQGHDFCRNLLVGSLPENEAIDIYERLWLPIERKCPGAQLGCMIEAYLNTEKNRNLVDKIDKDLTSQFIGGKLYKQFRSFVAGKRDEGIECKEILAELNKFALGEYIFVEKQLDLDDSDDGEVKVERNWACVRCRFPNDPSYSVCTACSLQRGELTVDQVRRRTR